MSCRIGIWGLGVLFCGVAIAAEPQSISLEARTDRTPVTVETLRAEIASVMEDRESVLAEVSARYKVAAPELRTSLEAEGAALQAEYERTYLTLMVEYHRITGNAMEMQRAERILASLNGVLPTESASESTGQTAPVSQNPDETPAKEGVLIHAQ